MQWKRLKERGTRMKTVVYGYGVMGKKVVNAVNEDNNLELVGVVSPVFDQDPGVASYKSLKEVKGDVEAIIDFSHPANLDDILSFALEHKVPVVLATTGFKDEDMKKIEDASKVIPIFQSYNTSYGVAMLNKMVREFTKEFFAHNYDVEILEAHHHRKIDAPSGTAKMLYDSAAKSIEGAHAVYDRESRHQARERNEIGMQSIRAGTIYGEHTVLYGGDDELIEIKHTALSRDIFAKGAVSAMNALLKKEAGLYDLSTLYE